MSDINLEFTVNNNTIEFTVEPVDLTFTPEDIQLTINPSYSPGAGGNVGELQYNNGSLLAGIPTATYTGGNLALGDVANLKITGGVNGYVLQTDGTGNLNWTAQTGGGGNGSPGGSNTQIQYNDNGLFGGNTGFTFNEVTGNVNIPGNLIVAGNFNASVANSNYANFAGNVVNSSQPNITSVGTLTSLAVTGDITSGNIYANSGTIGANVGTLNSLSVSGNILTTGTTSIQQAKEKVVISNTAATGTINFDLLTSAIQFNTANATANFTLNIRGNSTVTLDTLMNSNESMTCTFINTNGTTPYVASNITIGASTVNLIWAGVGGPGAGTVSGKDSYTLNIIKTGSAQFSVFASRIGFV